MTLKEFIEKINKVVEENPKALDYVVIAAIDDEGNGYNPVFFDPTPGSFDGDDFETDVDKSQFNSICIN
jgi:hypothetical protein